MKAYVEVAHGLDPTSWSASHARGEVPDRLPFGVDHLEEHGIELLLRPPLRSATGSRLARAVDVRTGGLQWAECLRDAGQPARWKADVVLTWDEWNGVPAALLSTLPGAPPVVTGIMNLTDWPDPGRRFTAAVRTALRRVAAAWVHAPAQVEPLVRDWGVPRQRIHVVPFGVDADFFTPGAAAPVPDLVVSVGDDAHRDHDMLVRAVRNVQRSRPAARLSLATLLPVAVPDDVGRLHARKLGGLRPSFYRSGAVVAVATRPNIHGSGLSVLVEAMASGRPFVATSSPGFAGYLESGQGGILVPPGDEDAFTRALQDLLSDPEGAAAMGRAGRQLVESRLNTRTQAAHLAAVLHSAVA